ncbi:MAG TPA: ABC transporter substrate-binding protein [Xanthobacteraceae bacterium]|nr:ABC transporter substrate-binding protein [Xanthobacteraceae bacterium]
MHLFRTLGAAAAFVLAGLHAASAQTTTTIRLGYIPVMGVAQVFVADGEGWFKEKGLDVKFASFESGPNMIQALASGTLDVYVAGLAPLLVARAKGQDVRVVAATVVEEMGVAAGPALAPFFNGGKGTAAGFKAFHEKMGQPAKLATQPIGSGPNATLQYWLWEQLKVDRADVQIIEMGIDATQRAILTGAVEGGNIREPALTIAQKVNPNIKLVATGADMFPNFPGVVVAVSGAFADKNPKAVEDLVRLVIRATKLLQTDPARAAPNVGVGLGRGLVPNDIILTALKSPQTHFTSDPRPIIEPTAKLQDYQVKIGALAKAISLDGLFAVDVYTRAAAGN